MLMLAFIGVNTNNRIISALEGIGVGVRLLGPHPSLNCPVDTHADMLMLIVGKTIFIHNGYQIPEVCENVIISIPELLGAKYPSDILLNIAIVGKHAFANLKHASKTALNYLKANGYQLHHVSQGYAHCSTCIVSDNAIITSDEGIEEVAKELGIDVLLIESGHISLPPYDYGFIGGASGSTDDTVYFCGSLDYHPSGSSIREFISNHGKSIVELADMPLIDVGGIIFK